MNSTLHSVIELHDSTVAAIVEVGTQVIVFLRAYVHKSEGRPRWDTGSGWEQAAVLTFSEGTVEGTAYDLPAIIWEEDLIVDGEARWALENIVPIPFGHAGEVALKLHLDSPAEIIIKGKQATLTLIGERG